MGSGLNSSEFRFSDVGVLKKPKNSDLTPLYLTPLYLRALLKVQAR